MKNYYSKIKKTSIAILSMILLSTFVLNSCETSEPRETGKYNSILINSTLTDVNEADPITNIKENVGLVILFDIPGIKTSSIPKNNEGNTFYAINIPSQYHEKKQYPLTVTYRLATDAEISNLNMVPEEADAYKYIYIESTVREW